MDASVSSGAGWQVYIVRCVDGSLYTGVAKDLPARLAEHNDGSGAKYTRGRRPVELVYTEAASDRSGAQRREAEIKQLSVAAKRALIAAAARRVLTEERKQRVQHPQPRRRRPKRLAVEA